MHHSGRSSILEGFSIVFRFGTKLSVDRLAYDAAMTRSAKAKKDKEIKEAEDELSKAKLR